jgi:hypothetical protein
VTGPTVGAVLAPSPQAAAYLDAVAAELADLPVDERADLLEDLSLHLAALSEDGDDRPPVVRLGRPAEYAAELRLAAGLPPRSAAGRAPLLRPAADLARRAATSRAGRELRAFLPQLEPGWWVARGYLVALLVGVLAGGAASGFPLPSPGGSPLLGLALLLAAVPASVRLGQAVRRRGRALAAAVLVLDLALVAWAFGTATELPSRLQQTVLVTPSAAVDQPLVSRTGPVTDIYPFAADETPLSGVLLYDQDGRPLQVGQQEWFADRCRRVLAQPRAADGVPVPHSFPQQYVLDPRGLALGGGAVEPAQCVAERPRPPVPLPAFPAAEPAPPPGG